MNAPIPDHDAAARTARAGLLYGLAAYGLWGIMPIYFKWLQAVPSIDIVAHRIVWSLAALVIFVTLARVWDQVRTAIGNRKTLAILFLTSLLIGTNWLLYVYAINSGHILAGSLGYYLNPLANILLGRYILKERLTRLQWAAVALAAGGIAVLAAGALGTLWISLTLCFSFATYGLLRKVIAVDSLAGLTVETTLLFPVALIWLLVGGAEGRPFMGAGGTETGLLIAAGIVSTVPLLCFTAAARRLAYSTVGILQFIAPTLQFALAVALIWLLVGGAEGRPFLGAGGTETGLLIAAGIVSTVPLLCFTAAARRLAYSTVGILQFIAPTLQFALAVAVYDEPFTRAHAIAFGCIWTALFLYVASMARSMRAKRAAPSCEQAEA